MTYFQQDPCEKCKWNLSQYIIAFFEEIALENVDRLRHGLHTTFSKIYILAPRSFDDFYTDCQVRVETREWNTSKKDILGEGSLATVNSIVLYTVVAWWCPEIYLFYLFIYLFVYSFIYFSCPNPQKKTHQYRLLGRDMGCLLCIYNSDLYSARVTDVINVWSITC